MRDFESAQSILNNDIFTDVLKKSHIQYMLEDLMKLNCIHEFLTNQQTQEQFMGKIIEQELSVLEKKILDLTNNIKMYNQLSDNDNSNYLKGKTYVKLGELIDPVTNYNLTIESFSKAISLSNIGNPSYY